MPPVRSAPWSPHLQERFFPATISSIYPLVAALPEPNQEIFNALAENSVFKHGSLASSKLPITMPYNAALSSEPADAAIDLTGPARCLTYGPYLTLEACNWNLTVTFAAWDNDSKNALSFDEAVDGNFRPLRWLESLTAGSLP